MDHEPDDRQRSRENVLAIALVVLVAGISIFFLYLISFGVIGNVLIGACLIIMVGAVHYFLWGKSMTNGIAAEREAQRRKERLENVPKPKPPKDAIQDLSIKQGIQEK